MTIFSPKFGYTRPPDPYDKQELREKNVLSTTHTHTHTVTSLQSERAQI